MAGLITSAEVAHNVYVLNQLVELGENVSWMPNGVRGYQSANSYIALGEKSAVLIDTGLASGRNSVLAAIPLVVGDRALSIVTTRVPSLTALETSEQSLRQVRWRAYTRRHQSISCHQNARHSCRSRRLLPAQGVPGPDRPGAFSPCARAGHHGYYEPAGHTIPTVRHCSLLISSVGLFRTPRAASLP